MAPRKRGQEPREYTAEEVVLAFQDCFASESGQVVLAYLMVKFAFNTQSTYAADAAGRCDSAAMAFKEGQRSVLVEMGKKLGQDPATAGGQSSKTEGI